MFFLLPRCVCCRAKIPKGAKRWYGLALLDVLCDYCMHAGCVHEISPRRVWIHRAPSEAYAS